MNPSLQPSIWRPCNVWTACMRFITNMGGVGYRCLLVLKKCNAILNGLALLTMAASIMVGSVGEQGYATVGLTAFATLVKGWNDFKKYAFKMDMYKFAYTTYEKSLSELRNYALAGIDDWLRIPDQDANVGRRHYGFHTSDRRSIRTSLQVQVSSRPTLKIIKKSHHHSASSFCHASTKEKTEEENENSTRRYCSILGGFQTKSESDQRPRQSP